jgi:serine/threonine protein kinase
VGTCKACGATYEGEAHDCSREKRTARLRPSDPDAPEASDELIGRRLGGYVVDRVIGKGGMGVVYRATHPVLGKHVAVKVIRSEHAADEDFRRRFMDEARVLAALDDPRIVAIQDLALLPDGRAYLVMEFVDGELLSDRIGAGRVPAPEAVRIVRELCAGLSAAHARGIVHRDIKPSNIVITDDSVKLLDFGLAKLWDRPGGAASRAGAVIGTPGYMPPEQASAAAELGPTADVYAVGVVLYEMLAGKRPFDDGVAADDWVEILVRQRTQEPAPLDGVPRAIDAVVRKALARAPAERFASAGELLAALAASPTIAPAVRPARRNIAIGATIGLAGLGIGGVVAWKLASSSSPADATAPATAASAPVAPPSVAVQHPVPAASPAPPPPTAPVAPVASAPPPASAAKHPTAKPVKPAPTPPAKPAPTAPTATTAATAAAAPTTSSPIPGAVYVGDSKYELPPPSDLAHFDASGYIHTASGIARKLYPDAKLFAIVANQVTPDGTIDLSVEYSNVDYNFQSATGAKVPPGQLAGRPLPCEVSISVTKRMVLIGVISLENCDGPPITTRCSFKELLARARADGAPADTVAHIDASRHMVMKGSVAACAAATDVEKRKLYPDGRCEMYQPTKWSVYYPQHNFYLADDQCGGP